MSALEVEVITDPDVEVSHRFMGNNSTILKKRLFIAGLRNEGTVYLAAKHAGINRTTAWKWRELDMGFSNAWDDALEDAAIHEEIKARITQLGIDPQTLQSASETRLLQKDTMATAGNNPDDHG